MDISKIIINNMILGLPLAIWFGILTIISLFITAYLGFATGKLHKPYFKPHMVFAIITLLLAIIHLVLVYLLLSGKLII